MYRLNPGERPSKTKVVFVQLGSPKSPAVSDVRKYLKEFLGDPRVVDLPRAFWNIILYLFVLPFRPAKSAKLYGRIWDGDGFPLIKYTQAFNHKVGKHLSYVSNIETNHAFLLSSPKVSDVWDSWIKDQKESEHPATELMVIPMFPQYSESTIASGFDMFAKEVEGRVNIPHVRFMTSFHRSKAFIDNSVRSIENFFANNPDIDNLMISFHGIPKRRVVVKEDDYFLHCYETFTLLKNRVKSVAGKDIHMAFQSRFGSEEWLTPYLEEYLEDQVLNQGKKKWGVYCPAFVCDCLETIDEIGTELAHEVKEWGGSAQLIPCLNDDDQWCEDFAHFVEVQANGSRQERDELEYKMSKEDYGELKMPEMQSPPLSPKAKQTLKLVFFTLFLDLVGFSIIFPLFPALAKHYLAVDGDNYFLRLIFDSVTMLVPAGEGSSKTQLVLFGGALGALYSMLQFIAAPIWGTISDRIGRRPVLLISVFFLAVSYLLWVFSGSFTLLIVARIVGGIMGGNISTATAVVADVTQKENRSKGMATIGIAFAVGFIIGPAMGGLFSLIDLTKVFPGGVAYGLNPFSSPAVVAFILSAANFIFLLKNFSETLPPEKRSKKRSDRTFNPIKLFSPLPYPGINLTNFGHFLFLAAFSGMEFTLTFLALERFQYTPMDNAYLFIFIGVVIALVQGGYVRRKASQVGERAMAMRGLVAIIPGLLIIAYGNHPGFLYLGLFFLAVGSSMAIPCLTALVSLYSPSDQQGKSIGIFRSLGALARVIGPIIAALVYWKWGMAWPYLAGAMFMLIPVVMVKMLPKPSEG
jgi:ferrochelatase